MAQPQGLYSYSVGAFKTVARFVLALVVVFIVLYLPAGFTITQSVALTFLVAYVLFRIWQVEGKPPLRFVPYYVHVQPSWFKILTDLELILGPHEYDVICETSKPFPADQYNIYRNGVRFTVLDDEPIGERTLVYSNDYHCFVSKVHFEMSLAPLTLSHESSQPSLRTYTPDFFVRGGYGAYSFGLIVPEWWWERKKGILSGKVEAQEGAFGTGTIRLTIAHIAGSEFTQYWSRVTPYKKGDEIWRKDRVEDRMKFGWTVEERPETFYPQRLEHQYVEVHHDKI